MVSINEIRAELTQRVFKGQQISVRLCEPPDKLLAGDAQNLQIVWEDPWLVVVDKPAGIVAHPVGEFQEATLSNAVQAHLDDQTFARGLLRPGIVHRLDRMTSGLIVITKDHLSHRRLSLDIQQGRTTKKYLAAVQGNVPFKRKTIDLPIGQHPRGQSVLMSTAADARRQRPATTKLFTLKSDQASSLVECELLTGRNHQIRVHMAAVGHPVLGDEFYLGQNQIRSLPEEGLLPAKQRQQRHGLHASFLGFQHPILRMPLQFRSTPPLDFWDLFNDKTN